MDSVVTIDGLLKLAEDDIEAFEATYVVDFSTYAILYDLDPDSMWMKIMSVLITVILYGRMIEIYLACSVVPITFATMTNRECGSIGNKYIKGLFALGVQEFFIMACVGIYAVLENQMIMESNLHSAIFSIAAHPVILLFPV